MSLRENNMCLVRLLTVLSWLTMEGACRSVLQGDLVELCTYLVLKYRQACVEGTGCPSNYLIKDQRIGLMNAIGNGFCSLMMLAENLSGLVRPFEEEQVAAVCCISKSLAVLGLLLLPCMAKAALPCPTKSSHSLRCY